jgi:hypothetical protein
MLLKGLFSIISLLADWSESPVVLKQMLPLQSIFKPGTWHQKKILKSL